MKGSGLALYLRYNLGVFLEGLRKCTYNFSKESGTGHFQNTSQEHYFKS
jgi:hypothetical protein